MRGALPCRLLAGLVLGAAVSFAAQPGAAEEFAAWRTGGKEGGLQAAVDRLHPGETLRLAPGVHEGPVVVRTPGVVLDGGGSAEINGRGSDTVVVVEAADVILRNLRIAGSGSSHEKIDAGVSVRSARNVRLERLVIDDALFGIDITYSRGLVVTGSTIRSKPLELGLRGDAIRIHASKDILVVANEWRFARDVVAWYSDGVTFQGNLGEDSRYSLHSMYTKRLFVNGNRFLRNSVGVFLMYSGGMTVRDNVILRSLGATGVGIGLKETSGVYIAGNTILYCATGILIDNSPWEPGTRNWIHANTLAFGTAGVLRSNDREGNEFRGNVFQANLTDVKSESRAASPGLWEGNVWDAYAGFDRDGGGVGDTPYIVRSYGDALFEGHTYAAFFYGAPVQLLIETIQRLVPLTEPTVVLEDPKPRLFRPGGT